MSRGAVIRISALVLALAPATAFAADAPLEPFKGMKYRLVGPWRGGRAMAAVGISSDPHTYYLGATGGGVWKTTNGGGSWTSLFDKQSVSSIGAIAVADADPNVVYVGTGEACCAATCRTATASTSPPTAARPGPTSGCATRARSGDLLVQPAQSRPGVRRGSRPRLRTRTRSAACSARTTAARPGRRFSTRTTETGAVDLAIDPTNPNMLFAALWEAAAHPGA